MWLAIGVAATTGGGCGDDVPPCTTFEGQCIGVPPEPLGDGDFCTDDVACADVVELEDGDDLASAAAAAAPGTCIALGPGAYGDASVPGGVSVLGCGAALVDVGSLTVQSGEGTVIRGVHAVAVHVGTDAGARIEAARIQGGGLVGDAGSRVTVADSEIVDSGLYGLRAVDAAAVELARTVIQGAKGPGAWIECTAGCDCAARAQVGFDHVLLDSNHHIGLNLIGAAATIRTTAVRNTRQITEGMQLPGGNGVSVTACSTIDATGLTVDGADGYGMLVDDSTGKLGSSSGELGIIIIGTRGGLWLQNITDPQGVTVQGADIHDVSAVGLGIGGDAESLGIIIIGTHVGNVGAAAVLVEPAVQGDFEQVGHGLVWGAGAQVQVDGLTVENSAMQSVLIDGPVGAGSSITNVTLAGGDEAMGIVQQRVMAGEEQPEVGPSAPALDTHADKVAEVPASPAAPDAVQ
jgi:hypothetical protein